MGRGVESRFGAWVDLVGDLLVAGHRQLPVELLLHELRADFDARASWNWSEPDGSFGFHLDERVPGWPQPERMEEWGRSRMADHPLLVWFGTTGDMTAMTLGRVPRHVYPPGGLRVVDEELRPVALEQQLSVPYRIGASHHRAFVLAGSGADFGDDDLLLARRIQPLLVLLARQAEVLACPPARAPASSAGLTGREVAVLTLLARGLTAIAIARALGISTRTVHVHLDHLYRKLSVHDRLMAVTVARETGLLDETGRAGAASAVTSPTPLHRRFSWSPRTGSAHLAGVP